MLREGEKNDFIVEGLLAVLKDLQWLIVIDTLFGFFGELPDVQCGRRVKVSLAATLVGGLISAVLTPNSSHRIQIFA